MTKLPPSKSLICGVFSSYQHLMSLGFPPPRSRWPCKRRPRCYRLARSAIRSPAANTETGPSGAALSGTRVDRPLDVPAVEQLKCEIMEFQPGLTDPSHGVRVMVSLLMLRFLLADSCAYSHWRLVSGFDSICSLRDLQIRAVAPPAPAAAAAAVVIPRLSAAQIVEPPRPLSGEPVLPVPRYAGRTLRLPI
ncbi:hypothetical protein B296_00028375 [Ensete ventricosum]|uniref:Uncharacterized protein n=1 Tax=Ensete ventricosum TaxID=4639 RepID=A0A426X8B8_ENSVE|nr:hypothetical protein B296_00028375 [Ensete ventricosum]